MAPVQSGGGLQNDGDATVRNSTLSGNSAAGAGSSGGAVYNASSGTLAILNATTAGNSALASAGGIFASGTVELKNTIIAGNTAASGQDIQGVVASKGNNLIASIGGNSGWLSSDLKNIDPKLGPLQSNGGTTLTHALLAGSPAIDAGNNTWTPETDQRGVARPQDANGDGTATVDIGSFELYHGEIHGLLFRDDNGNGIREIREPLLPDKRVYLDFNRNGGLDAGEPVALTSKDDPETDGVDEGGAYSFLAVPPGDHRVMPLPETGWERTVPEPRFKIERISHGWEVIQGNSTSTSPSVSADGRFVAFESMASNLIVGDTNGTTDIFVFSRQTSAIERISVAADGTQANNASFSPSLSSDGRYVAFYSLASNLVPGDANESADVFVSDRWTGSLERISVAADGTQANGDSLSATISADGRYVVFYSAASNLVPGDTNWTHDVFVHDRRTGTTERVNVSSNGAQAIGEAYYSYDSASISANGRYVAFAATASNLVPGDTNATSDIFVRDRKTGTTQRINVASDGSEANAGSSYSPSISADGRYVAFTSYASNLVPGDTNSKTDTFVYDRETGTAQRVSVTSDGSQANGDSAYSPSISADGRYVTFGSYASNFVPGDANDLDIFVHDRELGTTEQVSVASDESQGNAGSYYPMISGDGRYVAFESSASNLVPSDTNWCADVFVHDRQTRSTERVSVASDISQADSDSDDASISSDGRYVAFSSVASNLISGDTNRVVDVFISDRQTGMTERISVGWNGSEADGYSSAPSISADGLFVAFASSATNLVPEGSSGAHVAFGRDRQTGTTERISVAWDGSGANSGGTYATSISADGRYVTFSSYATNLVLGDTNSTEDVFVYDRQAHTTDRVSVDSNGAQAHGPSGDPAISADGRYVAFNSNAQNLVSGDSGWSDILVHDRVTGATERVSVATGGFQANGDSSHPAVSADGRYVAFSSYASDLVPGDTNGKLDIFIHDRQTGVTERASVASDGSQADGYSDAASISGDGRYVAFHSNASNLVPGDTNGTEDVFVHDRLTGNTQRASTAWDGSQAIGYSFYPVISADGRYVVFASSASNLVLGDSDWINRDVFVAVNLPAWQEGTSLVTVGVGETVTAIDFGMRPQSSTIGGLKYDDRDADGFQDPGEPGLGAWTVYLDLNSNGVLNTNEPSTTTDSHGGYVFTDLAPFTTYTVRAVPQDFWVQTAPRLIEGGAWRVEIGAGTVATGIDFGSHYRGPGGQDLDVIAGRLFLDPNGNGVQDAGEAGLAGRTVFLDANNNGQPDAGELSTLTAADNPSTPSVNEAGEYLFDGLAPGVHVVRAAGVTGWMQTTPMENGLSSLQYGRPQLGNSQAVATGDFDADGDADIVVAYGDAVALLRNNGAAGFAAPVDVFVGRAGSWPYSIAVGRFDSDDDLDLAVANYFTSDVTVLLNNGNGSFQQAVGSPVAVGYLPGSVAAGDLDGDGDVDLAVANEFDGNVSILRNNGTGRFTQSATRLPVGGSPKSVVAGRFYTSGQSAGAALDLAVANYDSDSVSIWLNNGSGTFSTRVQVAAGDGPVCLSAGDLDRDGDQDLVVTNLESQDVSLLRNDGFGSFVKLPQNLRAGNGVYSLTAVDLDHDTDPELIVSNGIAGNTLYFTLLRNLSKPGEILFGPPQSFGAGDFIDWSLSFAVTAGQFNDDNADGRIDAQDDLDLAIANGYTDGVSVVLNNVFPGAHRVTLTGVEPVSRLDFGFRSPGITVAPTSGLTTSEAGGTATFTVVLRTRPNSDVTLGFSSSNPQEGTVAPAILTFTPADWHVPQVVTITGVDDLLDDGNVLYSIRVAAAVSGDTAYSGLTHADIAVTNLDDEPKLRVSSLESTASGFVAYLNQSLDTSRLSLYDVAGGSAGAADVMLVGSTVGVVRGSVVYEPAAKRLTFLKTGGPLAPDNYTVTLRSAADGLRNLQGQALDGDADNRAGGDYQGSFTVAAATAVVVWLPDIARGPGQPVAVPATGGNLPLWVSNAAGIESLDVTIRYDPALLRITAAVVGPGLPPATSLLANTDVPGELKLSLHSSTPLGAGAAQLVAFTAHVPATASYGAAQVLDVTAVRVNEGRLPATADDALHSVAYFGDTTGNGDYSGLDAQRIARVVVQLDSGFEAFLCIDPVVIADIDANGGLSGLDAVLVAREVVGLDPPEIPPLPPNSAPANSQLQAGGEFFVTGDGTVPTSPPEAGAEGEHVASAVESAFHGTAVSLVDRLLTQSPGDIEKLVADGVSQVTRSGRSRSIDANSQASTVYLGKYERRLEAPHVDAIHRYSDRHSWHSVLSDGAATEWLDDALSTDVVDASLLSQ